MTLVSFYQVDHTFDRTFLIKYLTELETLLKKLIAKHLTEKSTSRVEQIFGVVKTAEFLDSIYVPGRNPDMRDLMGKVVEDLNFVWRLEYCSSIQGNTVSMRISTVQYYTVLYFTDLCTTVLN